MSTIKGSTVAAVKNEANEAFEKVKAELEQKRVECDERSKKVGELEAELTLLKSECEQFKKVADGLEQKLAESKSKSVDADVETEGLIEVVAIPASPAVKVPRIVYKGKPVRRRKDEDGFYHYFVTPAHAESLLTSTAGLRFVLVGPMDSLTVKRLFGVRSKDVKVLKHAKTEYKTGGVQWVPVIEEGSTQ